MLIKYPYSYLENSQHNKGASRAAQEVELLASQHEARSSNSSTTPKKEKSVNCGNFWDARDLIFIKYI
jgi:hypothetical protein